MITIIPNVIKTPQQQQQRSIDRSQPAPPDRLWRGRVLVSCSDIVTVNGRPWPYLKVEPRTYRLLLLNAANR